MTFPSNMPKIRFPQFNSEWQLRELSQLIERIESGVSVNSEDRQKVAGESGILKTSAVKKGVFYPSAHKAILPEETKRAKLRVTENTILVSRMNTPQLVGESGYVDHTYEDLFVPDRLWLITARRDINSKWLSYVLSSDRMRIKLQNLASGTSNSMKNISQTSFLSMRVKAPALHEQEKIVEFLTIVDERIDKIQRKVELLKQYKKGAMQQIFSQEIRFKDKDGGAYPDWIEIELGNLGAAYGGLTGKSAEDFGRGKPYITYKQVFNSTPIKLSDSELVRVWPYESQNTVKRGDVFFTISSETPQEIAYSSVLLEEVNEVYLNSFCFGFRVHSERLMNPEFLQFLFSSHTFREEAVRLAQGSTRFNISKNSFLRIRLYIPSFKEQQKVAAFFSQLDRRIETEEVRSARAKKWRSALLQRMFV